MEPAPEAVRFTKGSVRNVAIDALVAFIGGAKAAREAGASDESLVEVRDQQFLVDFIDAENFMGFHTPQEAMRCWRCRSSTRGAASTRSPTWCDRAGLVVTCRSGGVREVSQVLGFYAEPHWLARPRAQVRSELNLKRTEFQQVCAGIALAIRSAMEWLNYHHLLYFWMVAREGTVAKAGEKLLLAQPTISGQIRALEHALDQTLFVRSGRHLALTEIGRLVYRYADEMFGVGHELLEALKGTGRPRRVTQVAVGVASSVPGQVAYRLLASAWQLDGPIQVVCREGSPELLAELLATNELDVVVSDAPLPPTARLQAHSHLVAESPVAFFGVSALEARYRLQFPGSLKGAPLLLPTRDSNVGRSIHEWIDAEGLHPQFVGEYDDVVLMQVCGQAGLGLFPAPVAIRQELHRKFNVMMVGISERVVARVYIITPERQLAHPVVTAMVAAGRTVFGMNEEATRATQSPALPPQHIVGPPVVTAPPSLPPFGKLRMAKGSPKTHQPHAKGVSA